MQFDNSLPETDDEDSVFTRGAAHPSPVASSSPSRQHRRYPSPLHVHRPLYISQHSDSSVQGSESSVQGSVSSIQGSVSSIQGSVCSSTQDHDPQSSDLDSLLGDVHPVDTSSVLYETEAETCDIDSATSYQSSGSGTGSWSGDTGNNHTAPRRGHNPGRRCSDGADLFRNKRFGYNTSYEIALRDTEAQQYNFEDFLSNIQNSKTVANAKIESNKLSEKSKSARRRKPLKCKIADNGKEFVRSHTQPALLLSRDINFDPTGGTSLPPPSPSKLKTRTNNRINNLASSLQSVPSAIMSSKSHRKLKNPLSPKLSSPLLISPRLGVESRERSHSEERLNGDGGTRRQTRPKLRRGAAWAADDGCTVLNLPPSSPGYNDDQSPSPTGRPIPFYYTTPPKMQMATTPNTSDSRSRLDRSLVGSRGLSGLARRLSHKERRNHERKTMRQRSVSLDCGDGRHPLNPAPTTPEHPPSGGMSLAIPTSPSLPSKLGRNNSSTQNLPGRLSRKSSGNKVSRLASDSSSENLALKDKKKRSVYDIQSLFDAVEHADMETVQAVLDSNSLDINSVNEELLTPLDVAIMTNHVPMAKMLLSYGARENPRYQRSDETRALQLNSLVSYTQRHIDEILSRISLNSNNLTVSNSQQKETERQWAHWEFKHKLMKRMRAGYEHARIPTEPTSVSLSVLSSTSLMIKFNEPEQNNGAVITRYKVEWSCYEDFTPLAGEQIMDDPGYRHLEIPSLTQGNAYYVRVSAWNMKGYGPTALSNPAYAIPSSWREVDDIRPRTEGKMDSLTDLFTNIKNFRLPSASEIKDASTPGTSPLHPRKSNMRKSLKNLFSNTAPRFQRNLKRGIYISCLLYNEDKILVTNEDNLPILEVDENFTGTNLNSDFHWLMKIACTWEDVKTLRQDLDKSASSSYMMFRSKILQAATQLQSSLGVQDLGQFFYKPIRDASGSLILTVVNSVPDAKAVNTTHAKWLPLPKLQKKITQSVSTNGTGNSPENVQAPEMLLTYLPEMIDYQQSSGKSLPRGLYLGYLKLKSSVDQIQIMVPESMPNILPHTRVRDCPNVTREEWQWLRNISLSNIQASPTAQQIVFQDLVVSKCQTLLNMLGVSEDDAVCHRLYDIEVIDLSEDVSFLLLLPPVEAVCSIPGHTEEITEKPGYMMLPVQVFEMVHMCTYQSDFISRYSRASSILEMDAYLSQQAHREAFSSEELSSTRDRVDQLSTFQQRLDETWKGVRWTMDIVSYARDKNLRGGTPLGVLFAPPQSPNDSPSSDRRDFNDVLSLCTIGGSGSVGACSGTGSSDMGYHSDRSSIGDHGNSEVSTPTMKDTCAHHSPAPPLPPTTETNLDKPCPGTGSGTSSEEGSDEVWTRAPPPGIVRVYAAYETGLQRGACVKLQVTARTRSREVVNLVIQQLNKAAIMKGVMTHLYSEDQLDDFCLVAIIGARERVLRDSYQPLSLQNPWTNGKLYVRLKNNILAALEQGQVTSV